MEHGIVKPVKHNTNIHDINRPRLCIRFKEVVHQFSSRVMNELMGNKGVRAKRNSKDKVSGLRIIPYFVN